MSQIKQMLRLHQKGVSIKQISRDLHLSKNTVRSYLRKVDSAGWSIKALLSLDDPLLEQKFHSGNPAYKQDRWEQLKVHLDYYAKELRRTGVTKLLLYEEYKEQYPDGYGRSQFNHHLLHHIRTSKPSMVLQHKPGEKLYIDFAGKKLSYIDQQTGELVKCEVFVACMPYSDYGFAMAVPSQKVNDMIHALRCCLEFLGGVPELIVPDNLKSAVIKSSRYEPQLNRVLEDFANHYQTTVVPTRSGKPKDKALVEDQVKLIYTRVYARLRNQQFFSLQALNQAIGVYMLKHNQTRMQQKPWSREERFLAKEKELLSALPQEAYKIKSYCKYTVGLNNHVQLTEDKHYYSAPHQYTGKKVSVIYTTELVKIYYQGEQIAVHPRNRRAGGYTTTPMHLCSHHQHYLQRSPEYYLQKAQKVSPILGHLVGAIFNQDKHPEQLYRTCDGLINLYRKMDIQRVDKACQLALDCGALSYTFVKNALQNNMIDIPLEAPKKSLPEHQNVRGKTYYQQLPIFPSKPSGSTIKQ